jgi:hypothetical protein
MLKLSPLATTLTFGLFALGLLAGCATTPTSTPTPTVSVAREAAGALKGVNLALVNNSGTVINVVSGRSDSSEGLGDIPNEGKANAEGTTSNGEDVILTVKISGAKTMELLAVNGLWQSPALAAGRTCQYVFYSEGDTRNWANGKYGITVERLPDDKWKQFRITFTTSHDVGAADFCTK